MNIRRDLGPTSASLRFSAMTYVCGLPQTLFLPEKFLFLVFATRKHVLALSLQRFPHSSGTLCQLFALLDVDFLQCISVLSLPSHIKTGAEGLGMYILQLYWV